MLVKLKMEIRAFFLAKLCQLLYCPCPAWQGVTEEKYKKRKYPLSFNPSIQHLGSDDIYDFLKVTISCRSQDNYLGSPYPQAMSFRNKLQVSGLEDLPTSLDETAYEMSGLPLYSKSVFSFSLPCFYTSSEEVLPYHTNADTSVHLS